MIRQSILIAALTFSGISQARSEPQIAGVSGQTAEGQSLTISGTGFGVKSTAAPFMRENLEGGAFNSGWGAGNTNELGVNTDNNRTPFSSYNAHMDFSGSNDDGFFRGPSNTVSDRWFASYWFKLDPNWDWGTGIYDSNDRFLSNIKVFRMWNPGSINENFVVAYAGWADSFIYNMEYVSGPSADAHYIGGAREKMTLSNWHRFDFEFAENSAVGASDGQFRMWLDGQLLADRNDLLTREDFSQLKRIQVTGFDSVWSPNTAAGETYQAPNDFYIDDVYQDTTWARIELGDAPTYSATRHRELQFATQWTNGEVSFQVNQGSFAPGSQTWLYLTDAAGNVNESGFALSVVPEPSGLALGIIGFLVIFARRRHLS